MLKASSLSSPVQNQEIYLGASRAPLAPPRARAGAALRGRAVARLGTGRRTHLPPPPRAPRARARRPARAPLVPPVVLTLRLCALVVCGWGTLGARGPREGRGGRGGAAAARRRGVVPFAPTPARPSPLSPGRALSPPAPPPRPPLLLCVWWVCVLCLCAAQPPPRRNASAGRHSGAHAHAHPPPPPPPPAPPPSLPSPHTRTNHGDARQEEHEAWLGLCGHGRVGKHRSHPGGRGNAGGQHHHRINFDKYHPGYFGKVGMRHFRVKRSAEHCPSVNPTSCPRSSRRGSSRRLGRTRRR